MRNRYIQPEELTKMNDYCNLYVPVTVHREQSVKKEYQQDATI